MGGTRGAINQKLLWFLASHREDMWGKQIVRCCRFGWKTIATHMCASSQNERQFEKVLNWSVNKAEIPPPELFSSSITTFDAFPCCAAFQKYLSSFLSPHIYFRAQGSESEQSRISPLKSDHWVVPDAISSPSWRSYERIKRWKLRTENCGQSIKNNRSKRECVQIGHPNMHKSSFGW